ASAFLLLNPLRIRPAPFDRLRVRKSGGGLQQGPFSRGRKEESLRSAVTKFCTVRALAVAAQPLTPACDDACRVALAQKKSRRPFAGAAGPRFVAGLFRRVAAAAGAGALFRVAGGRRGRGAGAFGCVAFGVEAELLRRLAVELAGLVEAVLRLILLQRGAGLLAVDAVDL